MNCYEHTLIAKQDLPESQVKTLISKYENIINNNSGKVMKIEEWGLKIFHILSIITRKVFIFI